MSKHIDRVRLLLAERAAKKATPSRVSTYDLTMTVCRLAEAPRDLVGPVVEMFLESVVESLKLGKEVQLRGIGILQWKRLPARPGFVSQLDKTTYDIPERLRLILIPMVRFRNVEIEMEKYGVEFDQGKTKQGEKGKSPQPDKCPDCGEKTDSGGACPEHGTEPSEKRDDD